MTNQNSSSGNPQYSSQDYNVAEVENWLNSLPSVNRNHYVKLLRLDAKAGKNLVICAREYKAKHDVIIFENQIRSLPHSDIKREYFPDGWAGWFQFQKVRGERYYIENKSAIDAQNEREANAYAIQKATQTGMERALNNANYDAKNPNLVHFGTDTGGRTRR